MKLLTATSSSSLAPLLLICLSVSLSSVFATPIQFSGSQFNQQHFRGHVKDAAPRSLHNNGPYHVPTSRPIQQNIHRSSLEQQTVNNNGPNVFGSESNRRNVVNRNVDKEANELASIIQQVLLYHPSNNRDIIASQPIIEIPNKNPGNVLSYNNNNINCQGTGCAGNLPAPPQINISHGVGAAPDRQCGWGLTFDYRKGRCNLVSRSY